MSMNDESKQQRNSILALFFLAILAVMLIPMPPLMLDLMLCINITISLLILMAVLNSNRPVDFSTFPACCCSRRCSGWRSTSRRHD